MRKFPVITDPITYADFYIKFIEPNLPCVLDDWITTDWLARELWCNAPDCINLPTLFQDQPKANICVSDCCKLVFDAHLTFDMSIDDFITYWENFHRGSDGRLLYLKDWHYFKYGKSNKYYNIPELFSSDWLNEFWTIRKDVDDDFRFVYFGTKGTWTPLHADVYHSFSWSANIVGVKRWWFFPPGEECKLSPNYGHVPVDVRDLRLDEMNVKYITIEQYPGQIVFVPSGWFHEVLNLTDCLSINHNWFNATNVNWIWDHLQEQLHLVEGSTNDVRDTPGWHDQCQVCLRALAGLNFAEFLTLLKYILLTRWPNNDAQSVRTKLLTLLEQSTDRSLPYLSTLIDSELALVAAADLHSLTYALEHPDAWKDLVVLQDIRNDRPEWVRCHDFSRAAETIQHMLKHPVTKLLGLNAGPLHDQFVHQLN